MKRKIKRHHRAAINEDKELFGRARQGEGPAKDEILAKYGDWVVNIARKFHSLFQNIGLDELIAEGNRGILDAIDRFDAARKVKFSTYAWFWILKNIREYITSELAVVDLPQSTLADFKKITRSFNDETKKGKSPTLKNIAQKLKMNFEDVREVMSDKMNMSNVASLDKFLDEEDVNQRVGDMLEDKKEKKIHELLDIRDDKAHILRLLKNLSPLERKVVRLRFGFTGKGPVSLKEVGEKLKMSPVKAKDLETVSMRKLKMLIGSSKGEIF